MKLLIVFGLLIVGCVPANSTLDDNLNCVWSNKYDACFCQFKKSTPFFSWTPDEVCMVSHPEETLKGIEHRNSKKPPFRN